MKTYIEISSQGKHKYQFLWDQQGSRMIRYPIRGILKKNKDNLSFYPIKNGVLGEPVSLNWGKSLVGSVEFNARQISPEKKLSRAQIEGAEKITISAKDAFDDSTDQRFYNRAVQGSFACALVLTLSVLLLPQNKTEISPIEELPTVSIRLPQEKQAGAPENYEKAKEKGAVLAKQEAAKKASAHSSGVDQAAAAQKSMTRQLTSLLTGGLSSLSAKQDSNYSRGQGGIRQASVNSADVGGLGRGEGSGLGRGNGGGVQVAMVGGAGGAGYGKGGGVQLSGQGGDYLKLALDEASIDEGLSRDEVGRIIHSKISEIRYCYESSILRNPDVEGKLVVDFVIASTGSIKTASVKESSLRDPRLDECILKRLTRWAFPSPKSGVEVAVTYPFIFKSLRR